MIFDKANRLRQLALNSQWEATLKRLFGDSRREPTSTEEVPPNLTNRNGAFSEEPLTVDYDKHHEMVLQLVCDPQLPMTELNNIRSRPALDTPYVSHRHSYKGTVTLHTILTPSQVPPQFREVKNSWYTVLGEHQDILALYRGRTKPRHLEILVHDAFDPHTNCSFNLATFIAYLELISSGNPGETNCKLHTRITHLYLIGNQRAIKRFIESDFGNQIKLRYGGHSYLLQINARQSTLQPAKGWLRNLKGKPADLIQLLKSLEGVLKNVPSACESELRFERSAIADRLNYARIASNPETRTQIITTLLKRLKNLRPHWPHPYTFPVYARLEQLILASNIVDSCPQARAAAEAAHALGKLHFFNPEDPQSATLERLIENISLVIAQDPIMSFNAHFNERKETWLASYTTHYNTLLDTLKTHIQSHYYSLAGFITAPPGNDEELTPFKAEVNDIISQGIQTTLQPLTDLWQRHYATALSYAGTQLSSEGVIQFPQLATNYGYGTQRTYIVAHNEDDIRLPFSPAFAPPLPPAQDPSANEPLQIRLSETLKPRFEDPWTDAQLGIDNLQVQRFNPAFNKPTGLKEATLSRPVIEKTGLELIASELANLGYRLEYSPQNEVRLLRKARKQERALAPLYPLTEYERNAYYEYGEAEAQTTVTNPLTGAVIWQQGKHYQITPSWERTTVTIDVETDPQPLPANTREVVPAGHSADAITFNRTTTRSVEYGYATFLVTTESGEPIKIKEIFTRNEEAAEKEASSEKLATLEAELAVAQATLNTAHTGRSTQQRLDSETLQLINETRTRITQLNTEIAAADREISEFKITVETFNEVFPPPTPALATETYEEQIRHKLKKIRARFSPHYSELKDYQLRVAALSSIKDNTANGSCMGAGKTLMSIMCAWSKGSHYAIVVAPTKAMKTWAEELEKCGLYHELIGCHLTADQGWRKNLKGNGITHIRELQKRMHRGERQTNRLGRIETEFYVVSSELLALGDNSNQRYDLWHADYPLTQQLAKQLSDGEITMPLNRWQLLTRDEKDPDDQLSASEIKKLNESGQIIRIWSDRLDNQQEIKQAGWEGLIPTKKFSATITACPVCRSQAPAWRQNGSCSACGHHHRSHCRGQRTVRTNKAMTMRELRARGIFTTAPLPSNFCFSSTKNSSAQYPAYKLLGRKFGTKIVDEVHTQAGFNTLHGQAIQNIRTRHTILLSGTLCRTYISEIEPLLCLLHPPHSGQFPHAPWDMQHFRQQFSTQENENVRDTYQRNGRDLEIPQNTTRGRNFHKTVPEASNLTSLRAFIHGVHTYAEEHEIQNAWNLANPRERLIPVTLEQKTQEQENQWISELRSLYESQIQPTNNNGSNRNNGANINDPNPMFDIIAPPAPPPRRSTPLHYSRNVQRQIENYFQRMRLIADGPEKLEALIAWTREQNAAGHRCVLVGNRRQFYKMICKRMQAENIRFTTLDEHTAPEERHELLTKFRDSAIENLVSRTRLINTNYNQLTCCSRGLFWGLDPSPSAMEQMKYRLSRPGQTNTDIEWSTLITVKPNGTSYEQSFYNILLRKREAIRETLKSVDRPRTIEEVIRQSEERQLQSQLLEEILHDTAQPQS
jgi:hypothetical protein